MKIFLFGGTGLTEDLVKHELKLIEEVIREIDVKQILHIPFARVGPGKGPWAGDWVQRYINLDGKEYLNAKNEKDMAKVNHPLIFISGGSKSATLLNRVKSDPQLIDLIQKADYIIGESAGAKVLGKYLRVTEADGQNQLVKGLGIIKDTLIEPHYTENKRQQLLIEEMKKTGVRFGVGIDCQTGLEFEIDKFPEEYKKIGTGTVTIKTNSSKF